MEKIEQGIVPRVAEAMTKIEAEVQEASAAPIRQSFCRTQLQTVRAAEQRQID